MRLKPFLPLVVLAILLTACQTDFHGDDAPAMENKSLKIKDAKVFFEENRPTTTRTQGNVMSLGISEKCSPDWSKAKESENEHLYCVEVPLKSGFKFISTRKRKLGGKEIYLHQDVLRKLVVLKKKETNEIFMGVMSLVPKVYFTNGESSTSYDFNHFGDKCGYAGLVIYTNPAGTLVATDFYLKGERILHHHLSKDNPRMDIAKKIIGPVHIFAFDVTTRNGDDNQTWYCPICDMEHHYDDILPGDCFNVVVDTCQGCLNEVAYCTCNYNDACWNCGQLECECADYLTCSECGQLFEHCLCGNGCPDCGDPYCDIDHSAENNPTPNPDVPTDPVQAGRNRISCEDANINSMLDDMLERNLGQKIYEKIDIPITILLNQNHMGARCGYRSNGECFISIGNSGLHEDKLLYILMEELAHAAQFCDHGYDIMVSAKLNFEIEAKVEVCIEFCSTGDVYNKNLMDGVYPHEVHDLANYFFEHGYEDSGVSTFGEEYQDVIDYYRTKSGTSYSQGDNYPENPDYRNFNTFH